LTTLTLGLKVKRVYAVVVDIVAIFAGSIYFMLIADSFYGPFITFISLLARADHRVGRGSLSLT